MKPFITNLLVSKIATSPERLSRGRASRRWPLLFVAAGLLLATGGPTLAQAPPGKAKAGPFRPRPTAGTKENIVQKHDLQVKVASGTLSGNTYYVGGTIKNIGQAASPANRQVLLYVRSSDYTRWMYANSLRAVPSLKAGQEWTIPAFTIAAKNAPTNRFLLVIHTPPGVPARDMDANPKNDEKIVDAALVR